MEKTNRSNGFCLSVDLHTGQLSVGHGRGHDTQELTLMFEGRLYDGVCLQDDPCALVIGLYRQYGVDFIKYLDGQFVLALWDKATRRLVCATDRWGHYPLFYKQVGHRFICASRLVLWPNAGQEHFNPFWLSGLLYGVRPPEDETVYRDVVRLPPYTKLHLKNGVLETQAYWQPASSVLCEQSDDALIDEMEAQVQNAVKRCTAAMGPVGVEMSGGIDSALVGRLAAKDMAITTFSNVLPEGDRNKSALFVDESAEITANLKNIPVVESLFQEASPNLIAELEKQISFVGAPLHNYQYVYGGGLYRQAQERGISCMLGGYGGNELASAQARYVRFDLWKTRQWAALYRDLKADPSTNMKSAIAFLGEATIGQKYSGLSWWRARSIRNARDPYNIASDAIMEQLRGGDPLAARLNEPEIKSLRRGDLARMGVPFRQKMLDHSLAVSEAYGVESMHPLLDNQLADFMLKLPLHWRRRDGQGRYIFRRVVARYFPPDIAWGKKSPHGANNIPHFVNGFLRDVADIRAYIHETPGASDYIDLKKLDKRVSGIDPDQRSDFFFSQAVVMSALSLCVWLRWRQNAI